MHENMACKASTDCVTVIEMSTLPNVSATETADLRDVNIRIAKSRVFSYWHGFYQGQMVRVYQWAHSFWPRLF